MLKKKIRSGLALACLVSLTACGSAPNFAAMKTGTQVTETQMSSLIDNRSKQADVIAAIGHPTRKTQAGAKEIWYYDFTQIGQAIIGKNINETTAFEFNAKGGLVAHYKTGAQQGNSTNPLLKAAGK